MVTHCLNTNLHSEKSDQAILRDFWVTEPGVWSTLSVMPIDRYSLKIKSLCSKFQMAMIYIGEICRITWILNLSIGYCKLYCNFWCPGIRNSKLQRSRPILSKLDCFFRSPVEVSFIYRRVLSECAETNSVCVKKIFLRIRGSYICLIKRISVYGVTEKGRFSYSEIPEYSFNSILSPLYNVYIKRSNPCIKKCLLWILFLGKG